MFTFENIFKSYTGKVGCMCGCNGTYKVPSHTAIEAANSDCGYKAYSAEDVSDRSVKINVKKIKAAFAMSEQQRDEAGIVDIGMTDEYAFMQTETRNCVVYFNGKYSGKAS